MNPTSSGVSFTVNAITTATTAQMPDGTQNTHRQCSAGIVSNPSIENPPSNAGPRVLIPTRPRLIMKPKIPEKLPRSRWLNHAVLIFTIPGAPNACT